MRAVGWGESRRLTPGPEGTTVPLQIRGSDRLYLRGNSARVVELERQMKLNAERWAGRARSPHWEIGDSVLRVNFGAPETPEIEGWTLIGQEAFDPERGFGWESPPRFPVPPTPACPGSNYARLKGCGKQGFREFSSDNTSTPSLRGCPPSIDFTPCISKIEPK